MNPRFLIIIFFLFALMALWNDPSVVRASEHGAPAAEEAAPAPVATGPHGETLPAGESEGHGESEGEAKAAEDAFKLGPPLDGHFDLNLLRSAKRIVKLRYPVENLVLTVRGANGKIWAVNISFVVEFGSESGMAEIATVDDAVRKEIQDLVHDYSADVLLKTSGKLKLKDDMVQTIDRLLETASVRCVYLTDFQVVFVPGT